MNNDDLVTVSVDYESLDMKTYATTNINYGINGITGSSFYQAPSYTFTNGTSTSPKNFQVTTDAEFEGDVKIKGVSIVESIDKINKRLAILVPDPAKLEKFEALRRAYENYKTMEALCELPDNNER